MAEKSEGMTLGVSDRPSAGLWGILSLQHLFAMFGATVLVPLLVGLPPEVALVTSGVGTLIYLLCTGGQVPAYLGSSFAFIGPIITGSAVAGVPGALACGAPPRAGRGLPGAPPEPGAGGAGSPPS